MTATSKRVLVVDDEDVVCRSYERVLTQAGFEVGKAHSGPEALEEVRAHDYDVMLADLKMPGMDGVQLVEKLRETHPGMPVVVITGYPSQDTLHEAARLGVTDYLTKPVAPDVLTQATTQALTAPGWSGSAPLLATQREPMVAAVTFPAKLPPEPLLWPERPVEAPMREVAPEAVAEAAAPAEVTVREPGALRTAAHLAFAPVISIAYVMFLPFIGFALFIGLGSKALVRKVGGLT